MAENKNSLINVFGRVSDTNQKIEAQETRKDSTEIRNDIDFLVRDINGKIGELRLSPDNSSALRKALADLSEQKNGSDHDRTSTLLQGIKKIVELSGQSIVSKGASAMIDLVLSKLS